jgi:hypothetical protein
VNGTSVPYLRNSRFEAERASRFLSQAVGRPVLVQAVLVVLTGNSSGPIIKQQPDDVLVLGRGNLLRGFRSKRECLDAREITQIFDAARKRKRGWVEVR